MGMYPKGFMSGWPHPSSAVCSHKNMWSVNTVPNLRSCSRGSERAVVKSGLQHDDGKVTLVTAPSHLPGGVAAKHKSWPLRHPNACYSSNSAWQPLQPPVVPAWQPVCCRLHAAYKSCPLGPAVHSPPPPHLQVQPGLWGGQLIAQVGGFERLEAVSRSLHSQDPAEIRAPFLRLPTTTLQRPAGSVGRRSPSALAPVPIPLTSVTGLGWAANASAEALKLAGWPALRLDRPLAMRPSALLRCMRLQRSWWAAGVQVRWQKTRRGGVSKVQMARCSETLSKSLAHWPDHNSSASDAMCNNAAARNNST